MKDEALAESVGSRWKAIPDPKEAWEYLHAGLLYYGFPEDGDEEMYHYAPENAAAWASMGIGSWRKSISKSPGNGFKPNHIYIEE